ncbi:MAG: hypothetical protein M3071_16860 [Actinomycetota bacterium]|nr:hypothetical protein [Actinomycetota bacterium]
MYGLFGTLDREIDGMPGSLPGGTASPAFRLEYATRAHEILEDAQRDLLTEMDVRWSGEGVLGTAAGLAATNEVVRSPRATPQPSSRAPPSRRKTRSPTSS